MESHKQNKLSKKLYFCDYGSEEEFKKDLEEYITEVKKQTKDEVIRKFATGEFIRGEEAEEFRKQAYTDGAISGWKNGHKQAQSEMKKDLIKNANPEIQEILWDYSRWLHKKGYIDTDFYTEEPYAVDEYLKNLNKTK